MQGQKNVSTPRKKKAIIFAIVWIVAFSLVNYPVGAFLGHRIHPFIFGVPFSLFYFWASYTLLIVIGILMAWKLWRD
mgnify:CR=1 FL=1